MPEVKVDKVYDKWWSISDGHSISVIIELSVNASEGAHVAEYILSRELDSFPFSWYQNTQNILCHYGKDEGLKPSEADIFMDFEITHWGIFGTTQLDTGLDQILTIVTS